MTSRKHLSLVKAAETITRKELTNAPELPVLTALDAALLATLRMMDFHYSATSEPKETETIQDLEDDLVRLICDIAKILRSTLTTYYSVVQMDTKESGFVPIFDDIPF